MTRTLTILLAAACLVLGVIIGRRSGYLDGIDDGAQRTLAFLDRVKGIRASQERAEWAEPYDPEGLFV